MYRRALQRYPYPYIKKELENVQAMLGVVQGGDEPAPKIVQVLSKDCPNPPIPEGNNAFFYQCNKQDRAATPFCLEQKDGWIREVACH